MDAIRTLIIAMAGLLAFSGLAAAYADDRNVVLPNGWEDAFTGGLSHTYCERVSDDATLAGVSPIYCENSGFGATFADVGCSADFYPPASPAIFYGNGIPDRDNGCLDDLDGSSGCVATDNGNDCDGKDDFATGSVTVQASAQFSGNEVSWLVGNDRDDDGLVSATDLDGSSDFTDENTWGSDCDADFDGVDDPAVEGCYDDEFIYGTDDVLMQFTTPTFCFTHDRTHAGGDWDEIVVVFSANLPPTSISSDLPFVGTAVVELYVTSSNTACTRSGHADTVASFGGTPFAGVPDFVAPVGAVGITAVYDPFFAAWEVTEVDGTDLDCGIDPTAQPKQVWGLGLDYTITCFSEASCDGASVLVAATVSTAIGTSQCGGGLPASCSTATQNPCTGSQPPWFDYFPWICRLQATAGSAGASAHAVCTFGPVAINDPGLGGVKSCSEYNAANGNPYPGQTGVVVERAPPGTAGDVPICAGQAAGCAGGMPGVVLNNGRTCVPDACPGGAGSVNTATLAACGEGPVCPAGVVGTVPGPGQPGAICGVIVSACSLTGSGAGVGWTVGVQGTCLAAPWVAEGGATCSGMETLNVRITWGAVPHPGLSQPFDICV